MPDEKPRDWDKELAEVDKLLAKLPHADPTLGKGKLSPPGQPGAKGQPHTFVTHPPTTGPVASPTGVWIRVGLALLIGLGMTQWPYSHVCGLKMMFYLIGSTTVLAAGIWGAVSSWRRRMGLAHVLSLVSIVWGLVLVAGVVLPRVGYAKDAATWFCPEP
jgi:hypothetical protein